MDWPKRLQAVLDERMVNRSKLTKKLGLGKNAIYQMLIGHEPSVTVGVRLARLLGMTAEELFGEGGIAAPAQRSALPSHKLHAFALSLGAWRNRRSMKLIGPTKIIEPEDYSGQAGFVPVIAPIAAGEPREAHDGDFAAGAADAYVAFDVDDENAFALRVDGDSMKPDFLHGDIIIASPRSRSSREATHRDGMLGVVIFGSERTATFKVVRFGAVNKSADEPMDYVLLQPLNAAFPPMRLKRGEVSAIYPVVGLVRKES